VGRGSLSVDQLVMIVHNVPHSLLSF
jgi:hypothetical protein